MIQLGNRRQQRLAFLAVFALIAIACGGSGTGETGVDSTAATTAAPTATTGGAATTGGTAATGEPVSLRYAMWDANQQPAYQQCADDYMAANPNVTIALEQIGWGDYWTGLQTSTIAGNAPDIFTNYIGQVPEFADKGLLVDLAPLIERDNVDLGIYRPGLVDLWVRDGVQWGLPKDWDTVAIVYNVDMLDAAGVTVEELNSATWNPTDGGTFEEIIARLTLDANGNNGLSPDFDPENVVQFGFIPQGNGNGIGNVDWSWLAVSNGFMFQPEPWSPTYNYDSPELVETLEWLRSLWNEKGYAPDYAEVSSLGATALYLAGEGALVPDGSWMINGYVDAEDITSGFAKLPEGPVGRRSATNSLADSIWSGSPNQEAAWEFVKYLASPACLDVVGSTGVVFPSIDSGTQLVLDLRAEQGVDISAFVDQSADPEGTFLNPIGDAFAEVSTIMTDFEDRIFGSTDDIQALLTEANSQVNEATGG
ncbi:sugar ABC transporter substrate-binding protein [soil metagenome]